MFFNDEDQAMGSDAAVETPAEETPATEGDEATSTEEAPATEGSEM